MASLDEERREAGAATWSLRQLVGTDPTNLRTTCFLCGAPTTPTSKGRGEHVFPKWLLDRNQLRRGQSGRRLVSPTGTPRTFDAVRLPCCTSCNTRPLSGLEDQVSRAFADGPDAVGQLAPAALYVWMVKVLCGLLLFDNQWHGGAPGSTPPMEVPDEVLERYQFPFDCLRWYAEGAELHFVGGGAPYIQVFECLASDDEDIRLLVGSDYQSDAMSGVVALRSGSVGIVAALTSWPDRSEGAPVVERRFQGTPLHPAQFRELFARTAYTSHAAPANLTGIIMGDKKVRGVVALPEAKPHGHATPRLETLLAMVWGMSEEEILREGRGLPSFFRSGQPDVLQLNDALDVGGTPVVWWQ